MVLTLILLGNISLQPHYYTNTNYYYDIEYLDGILYTATNGGIVITDLDDQNYTILTNTDGLQCNRQICCAVDTSGYLWSGNRKGLALVDPTFTQVLRYPDQVISSFVQDIVCLADSIYIGSPSGLLFIQTHGTPADFNDDAHTRLYIQDGLLSNNVTTIAIQGNHIWVGTDQGITRFVKSFHPDSLDQYTITQGLVNNDIHNIEVIRDTVYVGSAKGLNVFNGLTFDTLLSNYEIVDISNIGDTIVLALDTLYQVGFYYQGDLVLVQNGLPYKSRVTDVENILGTLYCGLGNRWTKDCVGMGFGTFDPISNSWNVSLHDCLPSNHISEIAANKYGVFCALGARAAYSRGIGWLHSDGHWDNFTRDSILPTNHVHRCVMAPDERMWFCFNAISRTGADTMLLASYDVASDNWLFVRCNYLNIDTTYAVWDIEFDNHNNLYMTLSGPSDKLWVLDSSLQTAVALSTWEQGFIVEVAIDSMNRVWRTRTGDNGGLLMVDTKGTILNHNDDESRSFDAGDGMISKYAYGCVVDQDNTLYVANEGLLVVDDRNFYGYTGITGHEIFDVELDNQGRVWMMARDGLYYFDPRFNVINGWEYYELGVDIEFLSFSNELIQIQAFDFDSLRKCFWIGGETGLLQLLIKQDSLTNFDNVLIYPNPAVGVSIVKIKNVPVDACVSIYSISGRLMVQSLMPDGIFNEIVWTIPDNASSGLYFAVVATTTSRKVYKLAIVR